MSLIRHAACLFDPPSTHGLNQPHTRLQTQSPYPALSHPINHQAVRTFTIDVLCANKLEPVITYAREPEHCQYHSEILSVHGCPKVGRYQQQRDSLRGWESGRRAAGVQ